MLPSWMPSSKNRLDRLRIGVPDLGGVIQVMSNDLVDVRQGHSRKFLGDFLSRRSGTESGHDRIERHTGAADADGSVRIGAQRTADSHHGRPIFAPCTVRCYSPPYVNLLPLLLLNGGTSPHRVFRPRPIPFV